MRRLLPPWALVLIGAIVIIGFAIKMRANPPIPQEPDDPLVTAARQLEDGVGLVVDVTPDPSGGVRVTEVKPGAPASQLGIQAGDRIVACGARSVWHTYGLVEQIEQALSYGAPALLLVEREGEYRQVVFGRHRAGIAPPAGGHEHHEH